MERQKVITGKGTWWNGKRGSRIGSMLGEGQIQCSRPNKAGDMQQARRRERNFDERGTVHGVIGSIENR